MLVKFHIKKINLNKLQRDKVFSIFYVISKSFHIEIGKDFRFKKFDPLPS